MRNPKYQLQCPSRQWGQGDRAEDRRYRETRLPNARVTALGTVARATPTIDGCYYYPPHVFDITTSLAPRNPLGYSASFSSSERQYSAFQAEKAACRNMPKFSVTSQYAAAFVSVAFERQRPFEWPGADDA